jgi:hypothetical protein
MKLWGEAKMNLAVRLEGKVSSGVVWTLGISPMDSIRLDLMWGLSMCCSLEECQGGDNED